MGYCKVRENMKFVHSVGDFPELPEDICFLSGEWVNIKPKSPFIVEVDVEKGETPGHYFKKSVPILSKAFISVLTEVGIDNFQTFPVTLRNSKSGEEWHDYYAFNVLGLLDSMDMKNSTFDELMEGDIEDGVAELLHVTDMKIDENKTKGILMYRDIRDPVDIIFDERITDIFRVNKPEGGWRITVEYLNR